MPLTAQVRLAMIGVHSPLETALAFSNHFALFALLLRLTEPGRLPGGLRFAVDERNSPLELRNAPIGLGAIFGRHAALSRRILAHYSPVDLARKVLTGEVIRPIERWQLRYAVGWRRALSNSVCMCK